MHKLLLIGTFLLAVLPALSSSPRFTHLDRTSSGLCYDGVKTILEDSRGDMWFGTYRGLSRYDGSLLKNYDRRDFGVDSDHVSSLAEDSEGNIWIGTDSGVVIFDRRKGRFRPLAGHVVSSRVFTMARDSRGTMWVGILGRELYRCDGGDGLSLAPGTEDLEDVYRIAFDWQGRPLVVSYCKDIYCYESGELRPLCGDSFQYDDVAGIASCTVDGGSLVYVAAKRNGLCVVQPGAAQPQRLLSVSSDQRPTAICAEDGRLWMCTTGGLICYDTYTGVCMDYHADAGDPFALSEDFTTCSLADSKGGLWVGTNSGGVNYYHPDHDRFEKFWRTSGGEGLAGCIVRAFAEGDDGRVWIATERRGLLVMEPGGDLPEPFSPDARLPRNITALASDGSDLWIGSQQGLWRLDTHDSHAVYYPVLGSVGEENDNRVVSLFRTSSGDIYVCTPVGVRRFNRSSGTFDFVEALKGITVEQMAEDGHGMLWLASYSQGAYRYDPRTGNVSAYGIQFGRGPVHEMTSSLCVDSRGAVWVIGFSSGFYRYDSPSDQFRRFDRASLPQLPTDLYLSALSDQRGRLWLSSDAGLVEFDPASLGVHTFTTADGLLSDGFRKSGLRLSDGRMLFGCADGFVAFNPSDFRDPQPAPAPSPGFWQTAGGMLCLFLLIALAVSLFIVLPVYLLVRRGERRAARERDRRREAEVYTEKLNFFSNVIHEIKTPLTLIRTPLQNLISSGEPTKDQLADLQIISNSTDYLDQLVKELLEFVSVEEHGYVPDLRNTDIVERLGFVCYNFSETAKNANIRLSYKADPERIETAVDTKALSKIFNNLVHNAVKYSESWIKIRAGVEDGKVVVHFCNDGAPIPTERRESIFLPFVRYTNSRSEYMQSFGIGLAQARKLTELQGGTLILSDREDCTDFVLTLPLRQAARTAANPEEEPEDAGLAQGGGDTGKPLLLVVEDNADLASFLRRKLRKTYRVIAVPSAEQALEHLAKVKVDVLLTDIGLESMSGVELCRKVSQDKELSHIPIIISAISSTETKIKCMENGATIYIEKPFSQDYLEACIKGVLDKRRVQKEAWRGIPDSPRINLQDRDEDFLKRLDKLINDNMGDSTFSNKQIEESLYISRSSLNRKVKALLGTTPNGYVHKKRLAEAARMLAEGKARINEVAYAVGFNSPSYFAKCFKEAYGKLPAEYMKNGQQKESIEE